MLKKLDIGEYRVIWNSINVEIVCTTCIPPAVGRDVTSVFLDLAIRPPGCKNPEVIPKDDKFEADLTLDAKVCPYQVI